MKRAIIIGAVMSAITVAIAVGAFVASSHNDVRAQSEVELSPAATAALADGVVTEDEYAAAVQATVTCIRATGYYAADPAPDGSGRLVFGYGGTETHAQLAGPAMVGAECRARHLAPVEERWMQRPQAVAHAFDAGQGVLTCLLIKGFQLSSDQAIFDQQIADLIKANREVFDSCVRAAGNGTIRLAPPSK